MTTKIVYWTAAEIDILCKHYAYMAAVHIQKLLPRHTLKSIYRKASALGLRAYNRTADFTEYILNNIGRITFTQMAEELGCTKQTISYRVRKLRTTF